MTAVIQPLPSGFRASQRALAPGDARRVSPVMASVTFIYPQGTGCAPVSKLPREWYATICWGDGSTDEVWFCHRAEEWQADRDALPGEERWGGRGPEGSRIEPTGLRGGGEERVLPRVDPGEAWGVSESGAPVRERRFPTRPPPPPPLTPRVCVANKAVADILPTTYGHGQMAISGTAWSWTQQPPSRKTTPARSDSDFLVPGLSISGPAISG